MTKEEFVACIKKDVYDSAIEITRSLLEEPPGRSPSPESVKRSQWFKRLPPEDKEQIQGIIQEAAHAAVFEMMVVLDGVGGNINPPGENGGELELWHITDTQLSLLNSPDGEELHDIFNGLMSPEETD